jgi:Putative Actinobacterial Holin-X, holin superfamily III
MLVSFAFAFGLNALGIWPWASFLIVAGVYVLLAALAVLIGAWRFRGMSALTKTRRTVNDDLSLLRRDDVPPAATPGAGAG